MHRSVRRAIAADKSPGHLLVCGCAVRLIAINGFLLAGLLAVLARCSAGWRLTDALVDRFASGHSSINPSVRPFAASLPGLAH